MKDTLPSRALNDVRAFVRSEPAHRLRPRELQTASDAYFARGGKMIRPVLCCLAAHALSGGDQSAWDRAVACAAAIESFHLFTLVHDDVIDRDDTRRGDLSAHLLAASLSGIQDPDLAFHYGVSTAILAGDALLGRAFYYLSRAPITDASYRYLTEKLSNETLPRLLSGECLDTRLSDPRADFDDMLLQTIYQAKTGVLFEFSLTCGAVCAKNEAPDEKLQKTLKDLSDHLGLVFQLTDDYLGLCADAKKLGKPLYSDLREGKRTFFARWALLAASREEREFLNGVLGNPDAADEDLKQARDLFLRYGETPYRERLREHVTQAFDALSVFPDGEAKAELALLIETMAHRDH